MKRMVLAMMLACGVVLGAGGRAAAEIPWTDRSDVALTFGALTYTESGSGDSGPVIGLEGRTPLARRWTIGAAVAAGSDIGMFTDELSLTSLELNVARVLPVSTRVAAAVGGGLAAIRGNHRDVVWFGDDDDVDTAGWVLGAQIGAGLDWIPGWFVVGLKASYQFTQEFEDFGWGLDNRRITLRVGVAF